MRGEGRRVCPHRGKQIWPSSHLTCSVTIPKAALAPRVRTVSERGGRDSASPGGSPIRSQPGCTRLQAAQTSPDPALSNLEAPSSRTQYQQVARPRPGGGDTLLLFLNRLLLGVKTGNRRAILLHDSLVVKFLNSELFGGIYFLSFSLCGKWSDFKF